MSRQNETDLSWLDLEEIRENEKGLNKDIVFRCVFSCLKMTNSMALLKRENNKKRLQDYSAW